MSSRFRWCVRDKSNQTNPPYITSRASRCSPCDKTYRLLTTSQLTSGTAPDQAAFLRTILRAFSGVPKTPASSGERWNLGQAFRFWKVTVTRGLGYENLQQEAIESELCTSSQRQPEPSSRWRDKDASNGIEVVSGIGIPDCESLIA